jgi:hypothetical protein
MSKLKDRLTSDLKNAMRAKDAVRLRTIRSIRAALLQREIDERQGGKAELSEAQELEVLQKQAKQRNDSIEQFRSADRSDLVSKEQEELEIIKKYLPEPLSDLEIKAIILEVVERTGAVGMSDIGKVMGQVMPQVKGKADGRIVQKMVRDLLSQ